MYYDLRSSVDEENDKVQDVVDIDASKQVNITVSLCITNKESLDTKETRVEKIIKLIPDLVKDRLPSCLKIFGKY